MARRRSAADDAERAAALLRDRSPALRAEAPLLTLEALVERAMTAFGYDLALLARDGGAGRMANVRKLMRLAREFERNEGRDLAGFLGSPPSAPAATSARAWRRSRPRATTASG